MNGVSNGVSKTWIIIIGVAIILLATGVVQFLFPRSAVSPTLPVASSPSVENNSATSSDSIQVTASVSTNKKTLDLPSIAKGDTIASWNFKGVYSDNPELMTKAAVEIKRLLNLIGKGTYPDMSLYVGIANQYELLGDGKQQYDYLGRAIGVSGGGSGLPWHNLGVLMERLGALETARVAYEKSTFIQPEFKFYHYAYLEFLVARMKDNTIAIEKEYASAIENLGQDADILQLYSEWKKS